MPMPRFLRFRYSLRALLVFITLFMLWGGYHANQSIRERRAEQVLKDLNASFMYGPALEGKNAWARLSYGYNRVIQLVWRKRFITYVSVTSALNPEIVEALTSLPYLQRFYCQAIPLSDNDRDSIYGKHAVLAKNKFPPGAMNRICAIGTLEEIGIALWVLSDDDCRELGRHSYIDRLAIDTSVVSERGLATLLSKDHLKSFSFRWCYVTGAMLSGVPGSTSLELLQTEEAPVGKEFACFVARSPKIRVLTIATNTVNDEFVRIMADHPSLPSISLNTCAVTDSCIPDLIRWKALAAVTLPSQSISFSSIERLKRERPSLAITTASFPGKVSK